MVKKPIEIAVPYRSLVRYFFRTWTTVLRLLRLSTENTSLVGFVGLERTDGMPSVAADLKSSSPCD